MRWRKKIKIAVKIAAVITGINAVIAIDSGSNGGDVPIL
jgi:hypothetical protein